LKIFVGFFFIFVLIMLFPMTLGAIHNIQTDEATDPTLPCVSSPEDVVLTRDVWNDTTDSVISAVDNLGHVLTATGYVAATNTLTVTGWVTPATTCAIVYEVDALTDWTGMAPMVAFTPLLLWLLFMGLVVWWTYSEIQRARGG
jgi:hypothetical protein